MSFKGKHIIITGASSGIGKNTAIQLAKLGAKLTLIARRKKELEDVTQEIISINNIDHKYFPVDLSKEQSINVLLEELSNCDGIVHSAGIVFPVPIRFIKKKHLNHVFDINYYAPVLLTSGLLKKKRINDSASIVFISSIATSHPYFGGSVYVSSKSALEGFSKSLALEVAPRKIKSNIIAPALVKTSIFEETKNASSDSEISDYEKNYPFGFGEKEDITNAIIFLLSNKSRWITGQCLIMDGGLLLNNKT